MDELDYNVTSNSSLVLSHGKYSNLSVSVVPFPEWTGFRNCVHREYKVFLPGVETRLSNRLHCTVLLV